MTQMNELHQRGYLITNLIQHGIVLYILFLAIEQTRAALHPMSLICFPNNFIVSIVSYPYHIGIFNLSNKLSNFSKKTEECRAVKQNFRSFSAYLYRETEQEKCLKIYFGYNDLRELRGSLHTTWSPFPSQFYGESSNFQYSTGEWQI